MSKKQKTTLPSQTVRLEPEVRGPVMSKSAFPSAAEMDLDMWEAAQHAEKTIIRTRDTSRCVAIIPHPIDEIHAIIARRIEMLGDVYEELRLLQERAADAGLDTAQALQVLAEFVTPKALSRAKKGGV